MTDVHQTDVSGDGQPPTLAIAGVMKVACPGCGWTYVYEDDNAPRHWSESEPKRLVCPHCVTDLVITATTGHTAAEAIARAVQEVPEQVTPRQPSIPGLTPIFDLAAALDAIEEAALDARLAERDYDQAHEITKGKRKTADAANAKLRDLIAELTERRQDARYELKADGHAQEADGNSRESDGNNSEGQTVEQMPACLATAINATEVVTSSER